VDQTSWQPVADILTKKGYNVTLVENPLTCLAAGVDATRQALAEQDGKTVLVGQSWGGVVITEAGNDPKVSALVYVSAFAPDVGQSLATLAKSGPATEGDSPSRLNRMRGAEGRSHSICDAFGRLNRTRLACL
jgi:pimeloyl-ACP methyl ester carboxylesterase